MDGTLYNKKSTSKLKDVLKDLCRDGSETKLNWSSLIEEGLSLADSLINVLYLEDEERLQLEELSIHLWNKAVVLKAQKNINEPELAKLRHISFQVVSFLNESSDDEIALKKQVVMALKTARLWIDCKELEFSENVICQLNQTLQKLQHLNVEKRNSSSATDKDKVNMEKDLFHSLCITAELKFAKGQNSEAVQLVEQAKEMLTKFPNEAQYLSMLCYNFGVDCYKDKNFEEGISWLRESYDLSKNDLTFSKKTKAQMLRLLANSYMEWGGAGWQENAIIAVDQANKEYPHCVGIYLRLQLALLANDSESYIMQALEELLLHPDCSLDILLSTLEQFVKHKKASAAFELRNTMIKQFEMNPDIGLLLFTLLDSLLKANCIDEAKTFAQECITAHNTGRRLDGVDLKRFHVLFWGQAAHFFEDQNYSEAITWYNYSLSLYSSLSQTEPNLGKLQRNLATCYLHNGEIDKAKSAIELSNRCEPNSPHAHYITFKIALEMEDTEQALISLRNLVECSPEDKSIDKNGIICLAAHTALQRGKSILAIPALECLISHSSDVQNVLTALRCLLSLLYTQIEEDQRTISLSSAVGHIRTAFHRLVVAKDNGDKHSAEIQEEAAWFMKLAWNLGLKSKDDLFCMKEFFNLCFKLTSFNLENVEYFIRGQHCLLMSCACCLQLVREDKEGSHLQTLLDEVLLHVEEYKNAERISQNSTSGVPKKSSQADILLILYEFEALTKLRDSKGAEAVLERALLLPNSEPKLFDTLAALALDAPANDSRLSSRTLKVSIKLHLQAEHIDYTKLSADFRNLIDVTMNVNDSQEEALMYIKEATEVIAKSKDCYPEIEVIWLLTRSWNHGLEQYNCCKYKEAEMWCSLSIRLLNYLTTCKEDYEEQMMLLYGELLNCLEKESASNGAVQG